MTTKDFPLWANPEDWQFIALRRDGPTIRCDCLRSIEMDGEFLARAVVANGSHAALVDVARRFIEGCQRGESVGEAFFSKLYDDATRALNK